MGMILIIVRVLSFYCSFRKAVLFHKNPSIIVLVHGCDKQINCCVGVNKNKLITQFDTRGILSAIKLDMFFHEVESPFNRFSTTHLQDMVVSCILYSIKIYAKIV